MAKTRVKERKTHVLAAKCLAVAGLLFLLFSCMSFDIADWPSRFVYPHNGDASNFCGPMGAFFAYYLLYYAGPGVFVILVSLICLLSVGIFRERVNQLWLRLVGMALVAAAVSSSFYFFWPNSFYEFPMGSGGLVGVGAVEFLRGHFGLLGTFILIAATWVVGLVLLADDALIVWLKIFGGGLKRTAGGIVPAWSAAKERSEVLGEIWRKLSASQKAAMEDMKYSFDKDLELESRVRTGSLVGAEAEKSGRDKTIKVKEAKSQATQGGYIPKSYEDYTLPPLELLDEPQ